MVKHSDLKLILIFVLDIFEKMEKDTKINDSNVVKTELVTFESNNKGKAYLNNINLTDLLKILCISKKFKY